MSASRMTVTARKTLLSAAWTRASSVDGSRVVGCPSPSGTSNIGFISTSASRSWAIRDSSWTFTNNAAARELPSAGTACPMCTVSQLLRAPTTTETAQFFAGVPIPDKVEVRQGGALSVSDHGKGLFVREGCRYAKDEVILRESARLSVQHFDSRAESLCCATCHKYLDGVPAQLLHQLHGAGYAVSKLDLHQGVLDSCVELPQRVPCRGDCGDVVYCSVQCEAEAWEAHHSLLCAATCVGGNAALEQFCEMCDEVNDHLKLAAAIVANAVLSARKLMAADATLTGEQALLTSWSPWRQGVKDVWWHTAGSTEASKDMSGAQFEQSVRALSDEALQLLSAALPEAVAQFPALFSSEVWGSILGMLDLNCMGIRVGSPVRQYLDGVAKLGADEQAAKNDVQELLQLLPNINESFCDGTGFFSVQSIINHDCEPNAMSGKHVEDVDGKIVIRAVRDIEAGEELSISYVESDLDVEARQAQLKMTYHFDCTCDRCTRELSKTPPSKKIKRAKTNKD